MENFRVSGRNFSGERLLGMRSEMGMEVGRRKSINLNDNELAMEGWL